MTTTNDSYRETFAIDKLRERLSDGDAFDRDEVDAAVERAIAQFAGAPVRTFVPILVERLVRDDLRAAADGRKPR